MDLRLAGRTALVTGAADGTGAAVARLLAAEGVSLWLTDGDDERVRQVAAELDAKGLPAELSSAEGIEALFRQTGNVDVLAHLASGPGSTDDPLALSDEELAAALTAELFSALRLARLYAPAMLRKGWGRMVFRAGTVPPPAAGASVERIERAGVAALARAICARHAERGLVATCIPAAGGPEDSIGGHADAAAAAVVLLLSPFAGALNGAVRRDANGDASDPKTL